MRKYTICNAYVKQTNLVFVYTLKIIQFISEQFLIYCFICSTRNMSNTVNTLTWQEFLSQADQFMEMSRDLDDNWELYKKVSTLISHFIID